MSLINATEDNNFEASDSALRRCALACVNTCLDDTLPSHKHIPLSHPSTLYFSHYLTVLTLLPFQSATFPSSTGMCAIQEVKRLLDSGIKPDDERDTVSVL